MILIDDDVYAEMLMERVREFEPAKAYDSEFWNEAIEYLFNIDYFSDGNTDPMYVVDNIAVNGEILDESELKENGYIEKNETIDDCHSGTRIGNYIVLNWGL